MAKPSSSTEVTSPTPSTWPWTMWPPRRSEAFIASSRLTRLPLPMPPRAVTSRVWFIASVAKPLASTAVAVRQTPSTATESPVAISPASMVAMRKRAPSAPASTASTVPTSWTSPVNTSPLPETGRDQRVFGVGVDGGHPVAAAEQDRGDEHPRLVDRSGLHENERKGASTLEKERGDAAAAEAGEGGVDSVGNGNLDAGLAQRGRLTGVGLRRGDDQHRRLVEGLRQLRVEGQARPAIEDDAGGVAGQVDVARGEQGVVGENGADADRDRIGFGAPTVDQRAAALTGDPGRVAWGGRGLTIEGHRQLQRHQRRAGAGVLAEGLVEQPRRGRLLAGGELDLHPPVAQDSGAASRRLLARVLGRDHDPPDPGLEDRLSAGRLPTLVRAGLQRHVHRRPRRILAPLPAIPQRRPLGMQPTKLCMKPLADHDPIPNDNRSNKRIGTNPPAPALSELERPSQVDAVRIGKRGSHD